MSKTILYMVRHGQTVWNVEKRMQGQQDSPLTETGKQQAELLSNHLRPIHFDAIFTSPSNRAFNTAMCLKADRDKHIIPVHELMEINLGEMEGMLYADLIKDERFKERALNFREAPENFVNPGGETFIDVRNRIMPFFNDTVKIFKGKTVLMVSHTCAIKSVLNSIQGKHVKDFWNPMIDPTSYSIVEIEGNKTTVVKYGCTDHLGQVSGKGPF